MVLYLFYLVSYPAHTVPDSPQYLSTRYIYTIYTLGYLGSYSGKVSGFLSICLICLHILSIGLIIKVHVCAVAHHLGQARAFPLISR